MTDFAASMGLIQLEKLEDLNEVRENAKSYQILSINILGFYLPIKLQMILLQVIMVFQFI